MQAQYQEARQTKPSKPFFLVNWLTFGSAGRSYNRNIYEWNQACKPVITQYENLQVDVKLDSDELIRQQASFKTHQTDYQQLKQTLRQQNKTLMEQIRADREVRLQMLPHLEAMVNLLRLARRIANTRLDASLTKAVHISRQDIRVPEELSQKIGVLAQAVRDNVEVTPQMMQHAVDSAAGFLEAAARLEAMKVQNTIAEQQYNQELAALQSRFHDYLTRIDDQSAVLMKTLRQINTAQNPEQLKNGLLALMGQDGNRISKENLEDFINGTKTIEL